MSLENIQNIFQHLTYLGYFSEFKNVSTDPLLFQTNGIKSSLQCNSNVKVDRIYINNNRDYLISMRTGTAFLQFDWSKAGLSMDLPVFLYSHTYTKTSFRFLSRQRKYREAFMWLQIFYFKQRRGDLTGLLFCLDFVCQGLLITKIVSSPHAVGLLLCLLHECEHVCF